MNTTIKPKVGDTILIKHRRGEEPDYVGILISYKPERLGMNLGGFTIKWSRGIPLNFWDNSSIDGIINGKGNTSTWIYTFHPKKTPYEDEEYKDLWV